MNIAKFLITPVLQNICVWLLLKIIIIIKKISWKSNQPQWLLHDKYGQLKAKDWRQLTVDPPLLVCGKKTMQNNFTWYLKFHAGRLTIFSQVQRSLKIYSIMVSLIWHHLCRVHFHRFQSLTSAMGHYLPNHHKKTLIPKNQLNSWTLEIIRYWEAVTPYVCLFESYNWKINPVLAIIKS